MGLTMLMCNHLFRSFVVDFSLIPEMKGPVSQVWSTGDLGRRGPILSGLGRRADAASCVARADTGPAGTGSDTQEFARV